MIVYLVPKTDSISRRRWCPCPVSQCLGDDLTLTIRTAPSSSSSESKKAITVPITNSSTAVKRKTATSNNVIVTCTSTAQGPKAKRSKQVKPPVEMHDSDEDDSREEKAALASPLKGSESRKLTKVSYLLRILSNLLVNAN
jgi:hypothetical protein